LIGGTDDTRKPDFVIDCIDNIETKTALLKYCHERSIKVLCSGGAGMKCDPTKIKIRDISRTSFDP
jgi:tRNA A37 threonylcarbamoyladenosine dehydratase